MKVFLLLEKLPTPHTLPQKATFYITALSENMYEDGLRNITNVDFSPFIVKIMADRYKDRGYQIKYLEMNILEMKEFLNEEFSVIIDKGTLDSVLCGENAIPLVDKMMKEVYRVLSSNGVFICISYADEDHRRTFFVNINIIKLLDYPRLGNHH